MAKLQRLWVLDASQIPRPVVHSPKPRTHSSEVSHQSFWHLVGCLGTSDIRDVSVIFFWYHTASWSLTCDSLQLCHAHCGPSLFISISVI